MCSAWIVRLFPSLDFVISVIVKLCSVIVCAGTVRVPVSDRSVHLLIWMNPSCPAVSAAFMYSSLKSPVLTMSSPACSVAATLPALPLQLLISVQYCG